MAKKKKERRKARRKTSPPATSPRREAMERMMSDLGRLLEEQNFESVEEANAFLENLLAGTGGVIPHAPARTPLEEAQDLVYEAWDSPDPRRAAQLARQALEVCPDCADACNVLAETVAHSVEEACEFYRQGVEAGERAFGGDYFEENTGHFWGLTETRPYMRARFGLANCLRQMGREEEAIRHYEALLELNPNDNQGVRDLLLAAYLKRGDDAGIDRLYARYPDDAMASFVWSRVLVEFRRGGASAASRALRDALKENRHVLRYLTGQKRLPSRRPAMYGWGDENEAVLYVMEFGEAWLAHPEALQWLRQQATARR